MYILFCWKVISAVEEKSKAEKRNSTEVVREKGNVSDIWNKIVRKGLSGVI